MPEPFKNLFNLPLIENMAESFQQHWVDFDQQGFIAAASKDMELLELKQRSNQIQDALLLYLPTDFAEAGQVILSSLGQPLEQELEVETSKVVAVAGITGWAIMPLANYVGEQGHAHFKLSMNLFKELTRRFTSEFGVRFFLLANTEKTLLILKQWTTDKDQHVRRLVSEGARPRLPWAMQLPQFIKDPLPVLELLELLKDDTEEYVRRSVANNLNDIAKDHPDLIADIAECWMQGASTQRKKLIRHGCRTLIKQGHKKTLAVLGYQTPKIKDVLLEIQTPEVMFGEALQFTLSLASDGVEEQSMMIDYIVHHQKANGKTTPKVFKWRVTTLATAKPLTISKKHNIKKITTRVYYPGKHCLEVMINGVSIGQADFQLLMP